MAKIKRIIPFSWRNLLMGLEGDSKALAEVEYYYDGEDLIRKKIELSNDSEQEKDLKFLKLEYDTKKYTKLEYEKTRADILKKPWVHVLSIGFDKDNVQDGYFELDWNDWFIKTLEDSEYFRGETDEDLVNHWLTTICQNIALENLEDVPEQKKSRIVTRKEIDDGKAEYS